MTFTSLGTGGNYNRSLAIANLPAHQHVMNIYTSGNEAGGYGLTQTAGFKERPMINASGNSNAWKSNSVGSGSAFSICQPWIGVYYWRRTA